MHHRSFSFGFLRFWSVGSAAFELLFPLANLLTVNIQSRDVRGSHMVVRRVYVHSLLVNACVNGSSVSRT